MMDELVGKITEDIAHYMNNNDLLLVVGAGLPHMHPEHIKGIAEVACKTIMDAAVRRQVERSLADNDKILPGAGEPVMDEADGQDR